MATLTLVLLNQNLNASVQTEDFLYSVPSTVPTNVYPWRVQNAPIYPLGEVINIVSTDSQTHSITCEVDPAVAILPQQGDFLMFQKDNAVNMSSILGYYAEVLFTNNSLEKAELYAIGSNISKSS